MQFLLRRFRPGNSEVKDASRSGNLIVENADKIMDIGEADHHAIAKVA